MKWFFESAAGVIYLRNNRYGEYCWIISAHPTKDTPDTMKEHFEEHAFLHPADTEFIGAEIWHNY